MVLSIYNQHVCIDICLNKVAMYERTSMTMYSFTLHIIHARYTSTLCALILQLNQNFHFTRFKHKFCNKKYTLTFTILHTVHNSIVQLKREISALQLSIHRSCINLSTEACSQPSPIILILKLVLFCL